MIISIASGKGGTGKTTIATNLALSIKKRVQFLDCDVEEPNAHIFLKPQIQRTEAVSIPVPEIDESKCNFCGRCQEICAYNALAVLKDKVLTFHHLCHGCGGCRLLCPLNAIKEVDREIGVIEVGSSNNLQFIHGRLNINEMMSPPLIRAVKDCIIPTKIVIIDAPPGTSCPVIEAVKNSDFCILVTEPTPFGLNDLVLAVEVLRRLGIPFGVVINRSDIGDDKVDNFCHKDNIPILMRIPFNKQIAIAYSEGIPIIDTISEYKKEFVALYKNIVKIVR
ncbi:(4Fe-4S)-binding protein [bacterium SM23_31]|nr:MAG: (4Fe-4S)-binding protein [bacterium SM23_31]